MLAVDTQTPVMQPHNPVPNILCRCADWMFTTPLLLLELVLLSGLDLGSTLW